MEYDYYNQGLHAAVLLAGTARHRQNVTKTSRKRHYGMSSMTKKMEKRKEKKNVWQFFFSISFCK